MRKKGLASQPRILRNIRSQEPVDAADFETYAFPPDFLQAHLRCRPIGNGLMSDSGSSSARPEPGRIARSSKASEQTGWSHWLPGLRALRAYEAAWLPHDVVAGLVLTTMPVPVGIGYAVASSLSISCS